MRTYNAQAYKKLNIDFEISPDLNEAIDNFLHHINYENGKSEDCYRTEIYFWLKDNQTRLTQEQYEMLKDYYVFGGIYE